MEHYNTGEIWAAVWAVRWVPTPTKTESSRNINRTGVAAEKNANEGMLKTLFLTFVQTLLGAVRIFNQ